MAPFLAIQILHGNTALNHLSLMAGREFSAPALCQARQRLPLSVLQTLLKSQVTQLLAQTGYDGRWNGHRTFLLDGSSFSMPDTRNFRNTSANPVVRSRVAAFPSPRSWPSFRPGPA